MKQQRVVKHRGNTDLFLVSVFGHRKELWERAGEKDANMFSCVDKNSWQSDSELRLTVDNRTNKSLCLVQGSSLV